MLQQEAKEVPQLAEAQAVPKGGEVRVFSMEEVEKHDTRESAWFVHAGQVRTHPAHGVAFKFPFQQAEWGNQGSIFVRNLQSGQALSRSVMKAMQRNVARHYCCGRQESSNRRHAGTLEPLISFNGS